MELFKLFGKIVVDGVDKAKQDLQNVDRQANDSSNSMMGAFKKLGSVIATVFAVDKIARFGATLVSTAGEVQAENAQFEASFGDMADTATDMFNRVADATGVFSTRLRVTGTKAFSQLKGAGMDANEALEHTETFLNLAADAAAYYDISLEDAESRIRSFMRGNVEAGDAIGLFTSESQRNQYAVEMYGKKWIDLTEAQKQFLMLNVGVDIYTQSGALGQASREADGLANVTGNLKEVWRQLLATVGTPIMQATIPIMQGLSEKFIELKGWIEQNEEGLQKLGNAFSRVGEFAWTLVEGVINLIGWLGEHEGVVKTVCISLGVLAGLYAMTSISQFMINVGGVTGALTQLVTNLYANIGAKIADKAETLKIIALYAKDLAIKGALAVKTVALTVATKAQALAQAGLNAVMSGNPIALVIIAITALVTAFAILWNKSEGFRNFWINLWNSIKSIVSNAVDWITGIFKKIKLPHFNISGKFSLDPPSLPKVGVEWYKDGGVMTQPTLFGVNPKTGNAMVGGEAGHEAIAPISTLQQYVSEAVRAETSGFTHNMEKLIELLAQYLPDIRDNMNKPLVLDSGRLVSGIAEKMDVKLGSMSTSKARYGV